MGKVRLGYQPTLDGLRAVAVSAVVLCHATGYPAHGGLGVDIFFVLSGFLITTLLLEEHATRGVVSLRSFYVRRARRLLPALFALLLVFAIVRTARGFTERDAIGLVGALGYCTNLLLSFTPQQLPTALTHLWSLSLEEQFYLVWPVLLLIILRANRRAAVLLLCLVIVLTTAQDARLTASGATWRTFAAPDTRSVALAIGCLTGVLFASGRFRPGKIVRRYAEPAVFVVVLFVLFTATPGRWFHYGLRLGFACAIALLLMTTLEGSSALGRVLSLAPVVWLGKISYSLYLWHYPVFVALGMVRSDGPVSTGPLTRLAALALSLILASCSYYLVERPFRRPRTRLEIGVPRVPASATAH
jgi:peptidoglycan/LPS O-acetylase OafA/YrhL